MSELRQASTKGQEIEGPEVPTQLACLENAIQQCQEFLGELERKLEPVLGPGPAVTAGPPLDSAKPVYRTQLGSALSDHVRTVRAITSRIEQLCIRAEL